MKIQPDDLSSGLYIKQYDQNSITVVGTVYRSPIILSPTNIIAPWQVSTDNMIDQTFIKAIAKTKPQVVILGTGKNQVFPDSRTLKQLIEQQISLEIMDTGSACRTFNIIQSEARKVLAGLII